MTNLLFITILFWNLFLFLLMYYDKRSAVHARGRIPERFLLLGSLLFGAAGVLAGMYIFRHKTQKWKFYILVPCSLLVNVMGVLSFFL